MEREQFTFYRSFFEAVVDLPKREQTAVLLAICDYALNGNEPSLSSGIARAVFRLVKPTLDASARKAESGKKGGSSEANAKQTASKPKANAKQTAREKEGEKEKEKEIENECYPLNPLTPNLRRCAEDWIAYREEKGDPLTMVGTKMLAELIQQNATVYGEAAVIGVIRGSIASGYKGITWDALRREQPSKAERKAKASSSMEQMVDEFMREGAP